MRHDWAAIRAAFEQGMTEEEISESHGVALSSLHRRIREEGWRTAAEENSSFKKDEELPEEGKAGRKHRHASRMSVMREHREEWGRQRELSERAVEEQDLELAKLAKLSAEILKIRQEGERRAWGISDKNDADVSGSLVLTWRK